MGRKTFELNVLDSMRDATEEEFDSHFIEIVNEIARRIDSGGSATVSPEEMMRMVIEFGDSLCSQYDMPQSSC